MKLIIFIAYVVGLFIVGYDGMFEEKPALLFSSGIIVISAIPIVFLQKRMRENKALMRFSVFGVLIGTIYSLWLTDGELLSKSNELKSEPAGIVNDGAAPHRD